MKKYPFNRRYIKDIANTNGHKLGYVAKLIGVNQPWLTQIIAGAPVSRPTAKGIVRYCDDPGITEEFVLTGDKK